VNLSRRATGLRERMDEPDCDPQLLHNTYRQFDRLNRLLSGWRRVYRTLIRPRLTDPGRRYSVLDIGCGGGGLLRDLYKWAGRDGYRLSLLGIDEDPRAIDFAAAQAGSDEISFLQTGSDSLAQSGEVFDVVLCNHVLHHIPEDKVVSFFRDAETLTRNMAVICDPVRSRCGYALFGCAASVLFRRSFIREDGLLSIRRSFTLAELEETVPAAWRVLPLAPFRALLVRRK
jgi:2-polyprenyl-3-methyl-5-hydroxy-6-metoxy-1,4-benzoquinol methylase